MNKTIRITLMIVVVFVCTLFWTKTIDNLEAGVIIGKSKIGKATLR